MVWQQSLPGHAVEMADELAAWTEAIREVVLHDAQSAGATTTKACRRPTQLLAHLH
ncbi:MAG: hypothetical protein RLZZ618_7 [Pseudomonadota bacterium]|jgi:hypothetical protein